MYRQLRVIVSGPPDPYDTPLNIVSDVKTVSPTPEIDYHLDIPNIADHQDDTVQQALRQCSDNSAFIQHRLVLDIILAEKGGICKILNVSCCFYVPDEYENITNIIKHITSWKARPLQQTKGCERGGPQV
uniref:Uncharacterized protein n=1 Tax=Dicentrarchus labrax TaxID=13489 RepID=A0A8C4EQU9_DICLA